MKIDMSDSIFDHGDVVRATGLPSGQLQMWQARRLVQATVENDGPGRKRLFSGFDIVRLQLMGYCTNYLGITPSAASAMLGWRVSGDARGTGSSDFWLRSVEMLGSPSVGLLIAPNAEGGYLTQTVLLRDPSGAPSEDLSRAIKKVGSQGCIVLPIGDILLRTAETLEEIWAEKRPLESSANTPASRTTQSKAAITKGKKKRRS